MTQPNEIEVFHGNALFVTDFFSAQSGTVSYDSRIALQTISMAWTEPQAEQDQPSPMIVREEELQQAKSPAEIQD